jgi:thioredoxin reductase (NADPH)
MGESGPIELTLYSRNWSHLCDDMIAGLQTLRPVRDFRVSVIDVDADPALDRRFGDRIPVLMHGERELCHYRLDVSTVTDYLRDFR